MQIATDKTRLETLEQVTASTLENFAFMFAEGGTEEQAPLPADLDYITASVDFLGKQQSGKVRVAMSTVQCGQMAADVLGIEPEDLPDQAPTDAIQEWANILAGALVAALYGMEQTFTLSAPVATRMQSSEIMKLCNMPGTITLQVDEHLVMAQLEVA